MTRHQAAGVLPSGVVRETAEITLPDEDRKLLETGVAALLQALATARVGRRIPWALESRPKPGDPYRQGHRGVAPYKAKGQIIALLKPDEHTLLNQAFLLTKVTPHNL